MFSTTDGSPAYDCIVVGGGPAGSAAATLIALQGHDVMLLEKEREPKYKIGESLLPSTVHGICPLLGVSEELKNANFTLKRGGTFRWGTSPEPWTFDFAASSKMAGPTSTAYQVERMVFDRILLDNASKKGVRVRPGCKVRGALTTGDRVTGLEFVNEAGEPEAALARYVIDASGYESILARRVGERVFSKYFQNVAVFGYFENGGRMAEPCAGNIFCAAFEDGWFWYIPLRPDLTSVGVVLDKSRADVLKGGLPETLDHFIAKCEPIKQLLANARRITEGVYGEVRARQDYSYSNSRFWSEGIALVGDAACFVDPVFSSGVHLATYSALLAARSVNTCLRGDLDEEACFTEFERRYRREYANFYDFLVAFYNLEQDLPSYFWQAKRITNSSELEQQAFIDLVGGVGGNDERLFDTATFFQEREHLSETLFPAASSAYGHAERDGKRGAFFLELTSEITQMQLQAMFGGKRPADRPLFADGLVPERDGLHWAEPATAVAPSRHR
ncbi:MAG TPA: tryptophan 7-halogenase [Candidatus Elarobacter sp.]|nr:tryptophan 7-halogenase [Candidatus Elarobacter sp.]